MTRAAPRLLAGRPMRAGGSVALLVVVGLRGAPAGGAEGPDPRVVAQLSRSLEMYKTAGDWDGRRAELRQGFLRGAGLPPLDGKRSPPAASAHGRREHKGYSVENVVLESFPGFFVTGNLYRPLGRKGPYPAVLAPHGHFRPLGRYRAEHQMRCAHLARMGAVVYSYGMVGWQDSGQTSHDDPLVLALQTWNSIRATDYLVSLADVDPKRLAASGASGGGTQTLFAAFLDDRIIAAAPVVIVYPWSWFSGACWCESGMPVMKSPETNAVELAAAIAPRRLLVVSCGLAEEGGTAPDPTADFPTTGLPFIKEVYRRSGHPERLHDLHLAHEGHDYGPSKRAALYPFLASALGLETLPEDPGAIVIEPPEALAAVDAAHPLPAGALRGRAAIAAGFAKLTARE